MAKVYVTSAGGSGGTIATGVLQLQGGAAMSVTPTVVTDQSGTASTLYLGTTITQVQSPLRVTTNNAIYLDVEDGSGNNRFTVGRDPASQEVTLDFASNPTGSTTVVGAIRTYVDGVNLSEIMTFREDGNIGINTLTPGAQLDVHSASNVIAQFNRTGTGNSQIQHLMTGTARWTTGYVNATGNYSVYDNVNAVFRTNLSNTGKLTIGNGDTALTGTLNVKGSGSTSATTSLLVQNSAGTQLMSVRDDGVNTMQRLVLTSSLRVTNINTENDAYTSIYLNGSNGNAYFPQTITIGAGLLSPNASAKLQVDSTTSGFLPPRMTTTQKNAISSPAAGLMVYDTTLNKLCVYTTAWETITSI